MITGCHTKSVRHSSVGGITAKLNDIDRKPGSPTFSRINDHSVHRLDELLPWNWRKPTPCRADAA